ncbi:Uncharacterized protein PBTT_08105 [Plasmodiophora brassicae]
MSRTCWATTAAVFGGAVVVYYLGRWIMKEMLEGVKDTENARERKRQIKEQAQRKAAREERKVRLGQEDVRARRVALIQKFKPMELMPGTALWAIQAQDDNAQKVFLLDAPTLSSEQATHRQQAVEYQVNQRVRLLRAQASTNRSVPFASLLADEVEVPVESLESYLFDIGIDGWIENDRGDMRIHLAFDPSDIETRPCRPCNDANSTN